MDKKQSICCGNTLHAVRAENLLIFPSIRDVNDMLLNIAIMPFNTCLSLGVSIYSKDSLYRCPIFPCITSFVSLSLIWI